MALTMPQILMLNHAAAVNKARLDIKLKQNKHSDSLADRLEATVNDDTYNGKPLSELSTEEYMDYIKSSGIGA